MRQKPSTKTGKGRSRLYLLDFGAVKQVAKVAAGLPRQATGIYTPFFAPPEQIHGDQVFPSTDLYALAVTCISLLTGKEPAQLFDSYSNRWNWRSQAQVSDNLANILDRMLLTAPNQRFQSAAEVLTALNPFAQPTPSKTFKYHQPAWQAPPLNQPASPAAAKTPPLAPGNPPSSAPASPPVQVTAQPARPVSPPAKARFSLLELLGAAAFTGFEAGLLGIALISFFGTTFMSTGLWIVLLGALLFAQFRRLIERIDLVIVAAITLAIVLFVPGLQGGNPIQGIVVLAVLTGLSAVALTTLFRLIYSLLSRFL
jgi:serine/threonine-protein kinase